MLSLVVVEMGKLTTVSFHFLLVLFFPTQPCSKVILF